MGRSGLVALLAIIVVAAGGYFYFKHTQQSPVATTPTPDSSATDAGSAGEAMLFTWENWADPPFVAAIK